MQATIKLAKTFSDTFEAYPNPYNIPKSLYRQILYTFNSFLAASIVNEGKVYKMPYNVGFLGVFKKPLVGKGHFDYQYFKETGDKR